jgi:hypothetical protein
MTTDLDLGAIPLTKGSHTTREEGLCLLEAVAWEAGEEHTDRPSCVSPVLATFGRRLNDVLPDDTRQQLSQYRRAMIGTAGDGRDQARAYLALDWLARTCQPAWLDLAGLPAPAAALRALTPITDTGTLEAARPALAAAAAADADADAAYAAVAAADVAAYAVAAAAYAVADAAAAAASAADAAYAVADAASAAADAAAVAASAASADAADAVADAAAAPGGVAKARLAPTVALLQADAIRLLGMMITAAP